MSDTNTLNTAIVNVEFQELVNASNDLSSIASEMKQITEKMSQLIGEIRAVWQDDNGKKFADRFENEVQSKFNLYYGTVEEYSKFIKGAHDAYVAEHDAVGTAVNGG